MTPVLLSSSDLIGGAARATFRLHAALLSKGVGSRMSVGVKMSDWPTVEGPHRAKARMVAFARDMVGNRIGHLQHGQEAVYRSVSCLPSRVLRRPIVRSADILHLNWVGSEFMSIAEIGKICQPCVWTLHDMWAFCGSEHYAPDDASARWRTPYSSTNRATDERGLDVSRWVWSRKRQAWQYPLQIVTPSRWLAECAGGSALMSDWPISVVPNVLDTRQFQPWPKMLARDLLALPRGKQLVLFGAVGGGSDPRKGWDLLQESLRALAADHSDLECVVFGQSKPAKPPELGLPIHWLGHLNDDTTIALAYSAADVTVVPSRQENLPQTGTEAHACGCPVVAFNCTGLPDVVVHGETGYLAKPYDAIDLAQGIHWVLEDASRHAALGAAARDRAMRLWSPAVVVPQYLSVYQETIDRWYIAHG